MENNRTFGNSPAFSKPAFYHPDGAIDLPNNGLTKREYFAAMAMQGFITKYGVDCQKQHIKQAVFMAEFLIEELNKKK
jgi:hypothetical protein